MCDWRNVGCCKATANPNRFSSPFSQWLQPGSSDLLFRLQSGGVGGKQILGKPSAREEPWASSLVPRTAHKRLGERRRKEPRLTGGRRECSDWQAGRGAEQTKECSGKGVEKQKSGLIPSIRSWGCSAALRSSFRRTLPEFPGRLSVRVGADCHLDQTPGELSPRFA